LVDRPLLQLRSVAGGIHNRRRASGIRPFFLPDGRFGVAANGALWLEERPGGELARLLPQAAEVDDPAATPDGARILCASGKDQVTAGGGHNDHVWPVYALELASGGWKGPGERSEAREGRLSLIGERCEPRVIVSRKRHISRFRCPA
jgi:hypothetical protein